MVSWEVVCTDAPCVVRTSLVLVWEDDGSFVDVVDASGVVDADVSVVAEEAVVVSFELAGVVDAVLLAVEFEVVVALVVVDTEVVMAAVVLSV